MRLWLADKRVTFGMLDGLDGEVDVEIGPVQMVLAWQLHVCNPDVSKCSTRAPCLSRARMSSSSDWRSEDSKNACYCRLGEGPSGEAVPVPFTIEATASRSTGLTK